MSGEESLVCVISSGRSRNVPAMEQHLAGVPHVWVVPIGQATDYSYAGAETVLQAESTQDTHQRNAALRMAGDKRWCVQLDDDLKKLRYVVPGGKPGPISIDAAIGMMQTACYELKAWYAGVAPTDNAYFTRTTFNDHGFIRSAFTVYRPGSGLQYDDAFPLKGDYDLTCQHLTKFGRVARVDGLLASFAFGQGSGGCVDYRTPQLEEEVCDRLIEKWPGIISRNVKRPGEVLLRWHPSETSAAVSLV